MKGKHKRRRERQQQSQAVASSGSADEQNRPTGQQKHHDEHPEVPVVTTTMQPRWKTILEVTAIFFAMGYAIVTGLQWLDLRRNFKVDQRPWIGISGQALVINSEMIDAELKFVNSGKTPARNVQEAISMRITPAPLMDAPSDEEIQKLSFSGHSVLAPQATVTVRGGTETELEEKALILKSAMKDYFPLIDSGKDILYVFGQIIYEDTSGTSHTTKYCLYAIKLETGWYLAECGRFNEMN